MDDQLEAAASALRTGDLVVYPTETVYGLGADALNTVAIDRVFALKDRDRGNPLSMAVPDLETAEKYIETPSIVRTFMETFLPGPVTVVAEKLPVVPVALTGGRNRVGIRIPDHNLALVLLGRVAPVTATSANVSGTGSITRVRELDPRVSEGVAVVLDDGETPGYESTVVDPGLGTIHRRGALADDVAEWLRAHDR